MVAHHQHANPDRWWPAGSSEPASNEHLTRTSSSPSPVIYHTFKHKFNKTRETKFNTTSPTEICNAIRTLETKIEKLTRTLENKIESFICKQETKPTTTSPTETCNSIRLLETKLEKFTLTLDNKIENFTCNLATKIESIELPTLENKMIENFTKVIPSLIARPGTSPTETCTAVRPLETKLTRLEQIALTMENKIVKGLDFLTLEKI